MVEQQEGFNNDFNFEQEEGEQKLKEERLIKKIEQIVELLSQEKEVQEERAKKIGGLRGRIDEVSSKIEKEGEIILREKNVIFLKGIGKCLFVGDIHGDLASLEAILSKTDFERILKEKNGYLIFLGDYVDRGKKQVETLERIFELKNNYYERVIFLRGNHETEDLIGTYAPLFTQLSRENAFLIYQKLYQFYDLLAYVLVTENGVVALHGGIPEFEEFKGLETFNRLSDKQLKQILWNDPALSNDFDFFPSSRGSDIRNFGPGPLNELLKKIGAKVLIRGHEVIENGYTLPDVFDNKLATVFSTGGNESGYKKVKAIGYCIIDLSSKIEQWNPDYFGAISIEEIPEYLKNK